MTAITAPAANAEAGLADWLTKASVQLAEIHQAEGDALTVLQAEGSIDYAALQPVCTRLANANTAFKETLPTPDPKLTAEVQQAVDNFESAAQSCALAISAHDDDKVREFVLYMKRAERHLANADAIVVTLPPS